MTCLLKSLEIIPLNLLSIEKNNIVLRLHGNCLQYNLIGGLQKQEMIHCNQMILKNYTNVA